MLHRDTPPIKWTFQYVIHIQVVIQNLGMVRYIEFQFQGMIKLTDGNTESTFEEEIHAMMKVL